MLFVVQLCLERSIFMPQIIPIRDLKNTSAISQLCHDSDEPVYITKNGYGDMVIMSMQLFEKRMFINDVLNKMAESEDDVISGRTKNAKDSLSKLRKKYNV